MEEKYLGTKKAMCLVMILIMCCQTVRDESYNVTGVQC